MKNKFIWFWIKGSVVIVIVVTLELILGINVDPFFKTGIIFLDWVLTYLVLLTPLGAIFGYFFLWILSFIVDLFFSFLGFEKPNIKSVNYEPKKDICPFAGVIVQDKDTIPQEIPKPHLGEIFRIDQDWSVTTPPNLPYGWIDIKGEIHKGSGSTMFTGIQPEAVMAGGNTGIKIKGDSVWYNDILFGKLIKK